MRLMGKMIVWIPAIIVMIFIFGFSAEKGEKSAGLSRKVCSAIVSIEEKINNQEYEAVQKTEKIDKLQLYVRKTAHYMEYALLAVLIFLPMGISAGKSGRVRYGLSMLVCATYASVDEIHQLFVPGRSGRVLDVCIDSLGAASGLAVVFLFCLLASSSSASSSIAKSKSS